MKEKIIAALQNYENELIAMADRIFDLAETGLQEYHSAELLTQYLEEKGFRVERGIADLPTAFRAVYENGEGGPSFGLLGEYDALIGMGHACGHHMQMPSMIGAALVIRDLCGTHPCRIVLYGTPAEETEGGKIMMLERGCFRDIDAALMMHAAPNTCVDVKCMALVDYTVTFHGKEAHAAMAPEKGRSAFDAALLSFQGIEFLREHVREDTRMHYTVLSAGGPTNVVPGTAAAQYTLRSYDTDYLEKDLVPRFLDLIKGASLMTGTTYDLERRPAFRAKIPVLSLNALLMKNAELFEAPQLAAPREKTGSTDFGNVMYEVPGSCIRVAFVREGAAAHSQEYLEAGKTEAAHQALLYGSKIIAKTCLDMLEDPSLLEEIRKEFKLKKEAC